VCQSGVAYHFAFSCKEQDQVLCREADKMRSVDFKVRGKKMRKFMCKILLYNIWCILIGKGRLKWQCDTSVAIVIKCCPYNMTCPSLFAWTYFHTWAPTTSLNQAAYCLHNHVKIATGKKLSNPPHACKELCSKRKAINLHLLMYLLL